MNDLYGSRTAVNLMRAFAGECQARTRYDFAAEFFEKKGHYAVADLFKFTARQEMQHAKIFFDYFKLLAENWQSSVEIDGGYPIEVYENAADVLKNAVHNESEESGNVYPSFAMEAKKEGYLSVAASFEHIASIENYHSQRFKAFEKMFENNSLYSSEKPVKWVCLNCGYIHDGTSAPPICPVCHHQQGYFIRLEMASWGL